MRKQIRSQAALRANQASPFARGRQARARCAALVASRRDRRGPQAEVGFRAEAGRRGGGSSARRRAAARPGSPPRGRRDDDDDRAGRGSRASWGLREPSGGCDDLGRTVAHIPESGSRDRDDVRRAAAPAEWCASAHRLQGSGHRDRVPSPRGDVRAVVEDRLTGRIRVRQHRRVDVYHDLVAFTRGAGIDSVVERGLGDESQRVRLLLRYRGRLRRNVGCTPGVRQRN